MNKAFDNFQWQNKPSTATPLGKTNLQKLNDAIDTIDDRVIALDSGKVSSVTVTNTLATGDTIATITVDGTATNIKSAQITVDSEISTTSTNPVQNKVIAEALREVMPEVTVEGNPISITDGSNVIPAKLAEVTFIPKQDLHGYDSPWVGGAGKNKFDENYTEISTGNKYLSIYVGNGTYTMSTTAPRFSGGGACLFFLPNQATGGASTSTNGVWSGQTRTVESTDGYVTVAYRKDDSVNPEDYNTQIEIGSTATSYAPYSNICPISGRISVEVKRTGKNRLENTATSITNNGITYTVNSDGTVDANGTATANSSFYINGNSVKYFGNTIFNGCPSGGTSTTYFMEYYDINGPVGYRDYGNGVTIPAETNGHTCRAVILIRNGTTVNNLTFKPMIRPSSITDDTYEPYQGETYTETLGQTVYGGNADFVNGEGQNDLRIISENDFTSVSSGTTPNGYHWADVNIGYIPTFNISNMLPNKNGDSGWGSKVPCFGYVTSGTYKYMRVYCAESTIEDFKTAYAGLQIVFSRETPATLTLTPTQIDLLKGNNVLTTDGNSIKLVYSADIKAWVESQLTNS